jgi:hypothetical protein
MDNMIIGATTPAAGTFTTLTATGQTSLGGAAGAEGLRVTTTASAVNRVQIRGSVAGTYPLIAPEGSDGNIDLALASKGTSPTIIYGNSGATAAFEFFSQPSAVNRFRATATSSSVQPLLSMVGSDPNITFRMRSQGTGAFQFETGSNGNVQAQFSHTASAVNYVQVTGAATGSPPAITVQGSDGNIRMNISSKGTESVDILTNNTGTRAARFAHTASAVNYFQTQGSVAGNGLQFSAQGSDTNISQVFQSKGTGAIDLAAGSSGVNISNGGTVTAITRTATGSGYTSIPSVAITAPTTAGGVQATASITMAAGSGSLVTPANGGTGYTLNDVLTIVGGTSTLTAQFTVTAVSGGVVTQVTRNNINFGNYSVLPSSPAATTGGTGTGCTLNMLWEVLPPTITAAGSGYVEQPTVTFSGGGGSGAAAYATVGSGTVVRSLGGTMSFVTPGGEQTRIIDAGTTTDYLQLQGGVGGSVNPSIQPSGSNGNTNIRLASRGTGSVLLLTNSAYGQLQAVVSHTASAVNYVQVTGAVTGAGASALGGLSFTGSDANPNFAIGTKGTGYIAFYGGSATNVQAFRVSTTGAATTGNLIQITPSASGSSPSISAISGTSGSDANIDLTLTPKGTGNVRFGTYTADMGLLVQGYIEIKDSGGTVRKLAVIA